MSAIYEPLVMAALAEGPATVSEMVDRIPRSNYNSILNTIHILVEAGRVRVKEIRKAPKTSKPTRVWEAIE
nr:MAG TPA: transcriptional regulator [Caudoviricetes sp.]